jgi:diaminohydroxyphosphoribosylaminopyrimidine deaminase/5-amino-6-(5-phosphoribosylamino)uracil reductase
MPRSSPLRSSADPLARALALARRGRYTAAPNPMVGAVLVGDGEIVGEGWHRRAGEPHAEVLALRAAGERARGATLYVTLEPCAHFGRTPPCADALIAAGVTRVVACHRDPDPRTAGGGLARLAAAGVAVECGRLADEARALNLGYLARRVLGRPAVTLKWAASLDGRIATAAGESRWISGERARRLALDLREQHGAILVGSGTVLADDPRLTRRLGRADGPILRVVADRRLRLDPAARMFDEAGPVVVYTESLEREPASALAARGAEVVRMAQVTPAAMLADLARRDVLDVLVEGGAEIAGAFFAAGLWDRVAAIAAPVLLGGSAAPGALGGAGTGSLAAAGRLERTRVTRAGDDFMVTGLRAGCLRELSASAAG